MFWNFRRNIFNIVLPYDNLIFYNSFIFFRKSTFSHLLLWTSSRCHLHICIGYMHGCIWNCNCIRLLSLCIGDFYSFLKITCYKSYTYFSPWNTSICWWSRIRLTQQIWIQMNMNMNIKMQTPLTRLIFSLHI